MYDPLTWMNVWSLKKFYIHNMVKGDLFILLPMSLVDNVAADKWYFIIIGRISSMEWDMAVTLFNTFK